MPKLFVASFLGEAEAKRVAMVSHRQAEEICAGGKIKIKATPADTLHLTWIYLGETAEENIGAIGALMRQLRLSLKAHLALKSHLQPTEIIYEKLELWPRAEEARVVVLTPDVAPAPILEIAQVIKTGLQELASNHLEKFETFRPHLTVFRMGGRQALTTQFLLNDKSLLPVRQHIEIGSIELVLSGSMPSSPGALTTKRRGSYSIIPT